MTGRQWAAAWGAVVVVLGAASVAPAAAGESTGGRNEAPLADAGLDQEVSVNATVHLDATGSRDPDGSIERYEWEIERPNGTTVGPACGTCARTEFQVSGTGTYNATVTIVDDDGASSSDTLKIHVYTVEGPSVELSGPADLMANASGTFTATAEAGDNPLAVMEWEIDDSEIADREMDGETWTDEITRSFEPGTHELSVRVVSELGRADEATLTVTVTESSTDRQPQPCPAATWNETAGSWDGGACGPSDDRPGITTTRNSTGDAEACLELDTPRAHEWEQNNPAEDFECHNDVVFGGQTPSIQDTNQDGRYTFGDTVITASQVRRLAEENDGVTLDETAGGIGVLEFDSRETYEEVMGTSSLEPTGNSLRDTESDQVLIGEGGGPINAERTTSDHEGIVYVGGKVYIISNNNMYNGHGHRDFARSNNEDPGVFNGSNPIDSSDESSSGSSSNSGGSSGESAGSEKFAPT